MQVVDSGVPYAILRANGTDSLLDSETETQFITLAPLGSLPPTAASSGEQVSTPLMSAQAMCVCWPGSRKSCQKSVVRESLTALVQHTQVVRITPHTSG